MSVRIMDSDDAVRACHPLMVQLRPHVDQDALVERVQRQRLQGYRLAALDDDGQIVAVAGFRIVDNLAWGRALYVDDLVTDEDCRGRGHGASLFSWLVDHARHEGCEQLHLDSGVQRFDAHRFYLTRGMRIASHHFALEL
jgi:GNAT superfamily N-acetyltransferase